MTDKFVPILNLTDDQVLNLFEKIHQSLDAAGEYDQDDIVITWWDDLSDLLAIAQHLMDGYMAERL